MKRIIAAAAFIMVIIAGFTCNAQAGETRTTEIGITLPIRALIDPNAILDGTFHFNYTKTRDEIDMVVNNISNTYIHNERHVTRIHEEIHSTTITTNTNNHIHHNTLSHIDVD